MSFLLRDLLRDAQCMAAGNNRHFIEWIGAGKQAGGNRMPGLVKGDQLPLLLADDLLSAIIQSY